MLNYYFGVPFADGGDKAAIPSATQPDGSMSMTQGFGPNYELPYSDPNSKDIPRDKSNQLSWLITKAIQEYQQNGVPDWIDPSQNGGVNFAYPNAARVRYSNGLIYVSQKAANNSLPTVAGDWQQETGRLRRVLVYTRVAGVQNVSINGGTNTTVGASTYTPSPGTTYVIVKVQGGGGGGAGCINPTSGNVALGAPGFSGSFGASYFPVSAIGASQSVTVGVKGAGALQVAGATGATSSFGTLLTAPGGSGGAISGSVSAPSVLAAPNAANVAPSGANIFSALQSIGAPSVMMASTGGGYGGQGGGTVFGPPAVVQAANSNGVAATTYGGGGGGTSVVSGSGPAIGGSGQDGIVIVEEYGQ